MRTSPEQQWYYLTHSWEDKGVHTFPKGICPKVIVIARLEYKLAYYNSTVHRFNSYTMRTPPEQQWYYLTHSWEDKGVHTFPKGICPKVIVIARLEYKLAYYNSTVHRFNSYTMRTPPEQQWYYLTHSWEDKGVHTFPKGICPKVIVIARLEYKLAYYNSTVHRFNSYTMRTPPEQQWYYLTHSWEDKGVHTFPKGICPKVIVIARLEYKLAYYNSTVHRFNFYTMRTPPEQQWYYLTHSWEDKGVHTFPKGICPKVNVIARLEYKLAYYNSTVHRFNSYTMRTPPEQQWYYLTHSWEDKGVHTFPKGICPKVNVIARLEYKLAYYNSTVHRFNSYTMRTPPEQQWYYLTHSWEDKGVHTFPKGICPKVNVIARLEYKLAYYNSTVHRFNSYTMRTSPEQQWYYLTHSWEDKGVHTFPKGICPKVIVIARLEYKLAYYNSTVHHFNSYTMRTPQEQQWYYLTHSWEVKGVHTFPKGICPKVNVIARLEYKLAYYNSTVHRFNSLHHEDTPRTVVVLFNPQLGG